MNIGELSNSSYLSKKDLPKPVLYTIDRCEHENVAMEGDAEKLRWVLYFAECSKGLVLNVTNGSLIAAITGSEDSDGWIGQKIVLFVDPAVIMKGKVVGGIRVRAPRNQPPVQRPAVPKQEEQPSVDETKAPADDNLPF